MGSSKYYFFDTDPVLLLVFAVFLVSCTSAKPLIEAAHVTETGVPGIDNIPSLTLTIQIVTEQTPLSSTTPTSPALANTPIPSQTETPTEMLLPACDDPNDIELLLPPWLLQGTAGNSAEPPQPYQEIQPDALVGKDLLRVVIDIHGRTYGVGDRYDESAIIIDQPPGSWKVVSVVSYKNERGEEMNGKDGKQIVYIPLSDFIGVDQKGIPDGTRLNLGIPAGPIHARFWNKEDFIVEIYGIVACNSQPGK